MAEILVIKVEHLDNEREALGIKEVFYFEHFSVLHEELFQESKPKSVITSADSGHKFNVVPGIYELVFSEKEYGRRTLISAEFLRQVDYWQE
ncbi:MAG: hypothetical protein WC601_11755 [Desulfotomaculaceae bacterium]